MFVDTSAWYAAEVEDDVNHDAARRFLGQLASGTYGISVTTDYVLDETLTLLRSRRGLDAAIAFIDKIRKSNSVRVYWVDEGMFEKALDILRHSDRKSWSLTDCSSFALMKELSIEEAFTFDRHFEEAGLGAYP
ncbi:MAG: type II toxin-antitoxin system VapC family toxin [Thaumarchaeota archaeon]|nr:type II toxin-antitoxin system VapC family toxin [Nitrososphaerota archaeon]